MAYGRKTGGRQKGVTNRATAEIKQLLSEIIVEYDETGQLNQDLCDVSPETRLRFHLECAKIIAGKSSTLLLKQ